MWHTQVHNIWRQCQENTGEKRQKKTKHRRKTTSSVDDTHAQYIPPTIATPYESKKQIKQATDILSNCLYVQKKNRLTIPTYIFWRYFHWISLHTNILFLRNFCLHLTSREKNLFLSHVKTNRNDPVDRNKTLFKPYSANKPPKNLFCAII